jgi:hypothetical protein
MGYARRVERRGTGWNCGVLPSSILSTLRVLLQIFGPMVLRRIRGEHGTQAEKKANGL